MRKRKKIKKGKSCEMCKPWKHGWLSRWKPQDEVKIREFEKIKDESL